MAIYFRYMRRKRVEIILAIIISSLTISMTNMNIKSLHDFKAVDIYGDTVDFATFKGKKVLIVNTASKCGFTPQYADLQRLYEEFGGDNFTIVGFPSNDFLNQEPGDEKMIERFCTANYGVKFLMMSKVDVKGKNIHPIFSWLTRKDLNGVKNAAVKWNFQKFMIDEKGRFVDVAYSREAVYSDKILNWIKNKE